MPPRALPLAVNAAEAALTSAFDAFRTAVHSLVAAGSRGRRRAGTFAVEVLGKRLLSCPASFADSWFRTMRGMAEGEATATDLRVQERVLNQETGDDREAQQRQATAATVVGGWLGNYGDELGEEIERIRRAVEVLGFDPDGPSPAEQEPRDDARFDELIALVEELLRDGGRFRDDERLIVFTEYKTTLDYLATRLRRAYREDRVLTLFGVGGPGGMGATERDGVKAAFNDPDARVRILVATDAASEGLNLHRTARHLLHYDCPWNPSRLEQRNGRLDRYGQARDVTIHHFDSSADDSDVRFLAHVIRKANDIREDLGSANEIFDRAVRRRLIRGEDSELVQQDLDLGIGHALEDRMSAFDDAVTTEGGRALGELADAIGLTGPAMSETLESAMVMAGPPPQIEPSGEPGLYRLRHPGLPGWKNAIDRSVRRPAASSSGGLEPVRQLAFGPAPFIERLGDLEVFRARPDALLLHLGHPMMKRAMGALTRRRFPGDGGVSRWTVRVGGVPPGADGLVLLTVEELGVNELRETFHHWVRTVAFPLRDGEVGEPLPTTPLDGFGNARPTNEPGHREIARDLLVDAERPLGRWVARHQADLTERLRRQLETDGEAERKREDERYRRREGEVSSLIERSTIDRLAREISNLRIKREQGQLFDEAAALDRLDRDIEEKEREIERRRSHYEEIREQLGRERVRILNRLLPNRYTLAGEARVFPVSTEVRLPERVARGGSGR